MKSLMPFIFIAISVAVFYVFIDPVYKEVQTVKEKISENNELIDFANRLRKENDELREKYTSIGQQDRDKLQKVLPDTVDNVRLIIDMNNIADHVSLSGVSVQQKTSEGAKISERGSGEYGTIGVSFGLSTRYDLFKQLMNKFETTLRLVDIKSFSVSAGDGVFYNYNVSLDTYWLR
jgi:hypothetical protein